MENMSKDNISERIKKVRKSNKLTQKDFGEQLTVSASYISKIESGKEQPTDMLLKLISLQYNVSLKWLYGEKGKMLIKDTVSHYDYFEREENDENENLKILLCTLKELPENIKSCGGAVIYEDFNFIICQLLKKLSLIENTNLRMLISESIAIKISELIETYCVIINSETDSACKAILNFSNDLNQELMKFVEYKNNNI